jgi:two-component system response regulator FixJ
MTEPIVHVIDDDPEVLESLSYLLSAHGYAQRLFPSAEEFLQSYDAQQPGCLITDLQLGGMSGAELQERLLADGSEMPIIVLTGHACVQMAVQLMERGAWKVLLKPCDPDQLLIAVKGGLARDRELRERRRRRGDVRLRLDTLSEEERQVLDAMLADLPNKAIAEQLGLSRRTVDRRRRSVLDKMRATSVPELATLLAEERRENK